jgi:hypothetical protein
MADLSKIKVGDSLKIVVEVTYADDAIGAPVRVVGDFFRTVENGKEELWISRQLVEAAEHIPAPRVFKRGDWVKWSDQEEEHRKCLVLGGGATDVAKLRGLLRVDVPGEGVCEIHPQNLEPDEAPE